MKKSKKSFLATTICCIVAVIGIIVSGVVINIQNTNKNADARSSASSVLNDKKQTSSLTPTPTPMPTPTPEPTPEPSNSFEEVSEVEVEYVYEEEDETPNSQEEVVSEDSTTETIYDGEMLYLGEFDAVAYYGGSCTATGTTPTPGRTIAVDPNVIPYGTTVYIESESICGYYVAEDCGGGIHGYILDIYMGSYDECVQWGRRSVSIYITE